MTEWTGYGEPPTSGGLPHPAPAVDRPCRTHGRRIVAALRRWDSARMPSTTFMYVDSDVPEGMTLDAWRRRGNALSSPPSLLARIWRAFSG
jgi:hypothetical protein